MLISAGSFFSPILGGGGGFRLPRYFHNSSFAFAQ